MKFISRLFRQKAGRRRNFDMAEAGRILADWNTTESDINQLLKGSLGTLRRRSRELCENNAYGRKFLNLCKTNVVGPEGFTLQSVPLTPAGDIDTAAADVIEAAWRRFCRVGTCTVDKKLSLTDVLNLLVTSIPRDGEFLARKVRGKKAGNEFGFALQILPPETLSERKHDAREQIFMGVKKDDYGAPLSYYLNSSTSDNPGQPVREFKAADIIHLFSAEYADQVRGKPWTTASGVRLYLAGKYEIAELVAARLGASKTGFFTRDPNSAGEYYGDEEDENGNKISEVQPGVFEELPAGLDFKSFDPQHPTTAYPNFMDASLMGAAAGFNIQHASLTANLSKGNYGSLRLGALEERDVWKCFQSWVVDHFLVGLFEEWLEMAIASGAVKLDISKLDNWTRARWQGRRWMWVDPAKDAKASEMQHEMGVVSEIRLARELGHDLYEIYEERARAKAWRDSFGLNGGDDDPTSQDN